MESQSKFNLTSLWKPLLLIAAVGFIYSAVITKLGYDWWTDENYSHGLLVPFLIAYIIWIEFDGIKKAVGNPSIWLGGAIILAALFGLLAGTLGSELFTQRISLILMIAGIIVYFWGTKIIGTLIVPFLLFLFTIPIPQIIFNKIAFPLQIQASQIAIWGIRLFQIPSTRKGNVIEILPQGATQIVALEVVEACSGIRSLMTLITLALVLAYFTRSGDSLNGARGWFKSFDVWKAIILMISAIPIAIISNAGRVTATGALTYYYGKQAASGTTHDILGWLVYLVALILLLLVNYLLVFGRKLVIGRKAAR